MNIYTFLESGNRVPTSPIYNVYNIVGTFPNVLIYLVENRHVWFPLPQYTTYIRGLIMSIYGEMTWIMGSAQALKVPGTFFLQEN